MLTRREQLGTEDFQQPTAPSTGRGRGRGKGKRKGAGKGEKKEEPEKSPKTRGKTPKEDLGEDPKSKPKSSAKKPKTEEKDPKSKPKSRARKPKTEEKDPKKKTPEKKDPSPKKQDPSPEPRKKRARTSKPPASAPAAESQPKKKPSKKEDIPASQPRKEEDGEETKVVATWGGRWVDKGNGFSKLKMKVIKGVFEECLMHKLRSQSSFQSPFFKLCNQAFMEQDLNETSPESSLVTCAKNQVAKFMEEDRVRPWFLLSWFTFSFFKRNIGILEN